MSGALAKVLSRQCGGNTRGLLYIVKDGREMKNSRVRGKRSGLTNKLSPQDGAFSGDWLDQKSKSPLFSGMGDVITNDLCISISDTSCFASAFSFALFQSNFYLYYI